MVSSRRPITPPMARPKPGWSISPSEWAGHRIRFNVVAPGSIATPRIPTQDPEKERAGMGLVPMKWRGSIQDIAKALVFFQSDLSSYITGQTLAVDGGYSVVGPIDYTRFGKMKNTTLDAVKNPESAK